MTVWMTTVGRSGNAPAWSLLDFHVEACAVEAYSEVLDEHLDVGRVAIVRTDSLRCLHLAGKDYELMPHRDIFAPVHGTVVVRNKEADRVETVVGRHGALARVIWWLGNRRAIVGEDAVVMSVTAVNSYDGSRSVVVMPSGVRFSDGADVRIPWTGRRHVNPLDDDMMVHDTEEALAAMDDVVDEWGRWAERELDRATFRRGVREALGKRAEPKVLARLDADGGWSVWDAYCAMAWYASHHLATGDRRIRDQRLLEKQERAHANALALVETMMEETT